MSLKQDMSRIMAAAALAGGCSEKELAAVRANFDVDRLGAELRAAGNRIAAAGEAVVLPLYIDHLKEAFPEFVRQTVAETA